MSKIVWDQVGEKTYETGVRNCVLYVQDSEGKYPKGVAWNGITAVSESPSGAETTKLYADDAKYLNLVSAEEFGCSITAYTYPDEFMQCDGSADLSDGVFIGQQSRRPFGLSYRTTLGNDTESNEYGYKLHIVYGCLAAPSEKSYSTINDSPEAIEFSWEISTTPVPVEGHKVTATVVIDSTKVKNKAALAKLEEALYGTDETESYLPLPNEIAEMFKAQPAG